MVKEWKVKGFATTKESISPFEEKIMLGDKSTVTDVKEFYKRRYPFNVDIEILNASIIKKTKRIV